MISRSTLNGFKALVLISLLCWCQLVSASSKPWEYEFTPYLWFAGLKGNVGIKQTNTFVDAEFDDLLKNLETGAMFVWGAKKDNWATWVDVIYLDFEKETDRKLVTTKGDLQHTIAELAVSYRANKYSPTEWYFGGRFVDVDAGLTLAPFGALSGSDNWFDPLVGVKTEHKLHKKFSMMVRTDLGGFGLGSDISWHFSLAGHYKFSPKMSVILAYRYLDFDFEDDMFRYNAALDGLGLGVNVKF